MTAGQHSVASVSLATISSILFASAMLILYWQFRAYDLPYIVMTPQAHFAKMSDGDMLIVGRQFQVTRDTEFYITRELMQKQSVGALLRFELPSTHVFYTAGEYETQRIHELPLLKPGPYELHNRLCWTANILRRDCLDLPVLTVDIRG